jgi:hypothetical protein
MKRYVLFFALITCMIVASVSAQDKLVIGPNDLPSQSELITIQDDSTGNYLIFNITSGEYKYIRCENQTGLSGIGKAKVDGCLITFEDIEQDRRVVASVDECTQVAKASITLVQFSTADTKPAKELLSDTDMRNSTTDCAAVKLQPKR